MIHCSHCGADNIDDGSFCVRCGSRLGHVDSLRDVASPAESAGPIEEHLGDGTEDHSPTSSDTKPPAGRARKRTRWAVLAVALVLVVGGSVTAGVVFHRHGRGAGSSAPGDATLHLTAAQSCTLKTLNVTKHLWTTPFSDWTSEIQATQQQLLGRYGSGSKFLNAFNAAVSVGVQKAFLHGAVSAQIAEMAPVATACGSTHPNTVFANAPPPTTTTTTTLWDATATTVSPVPITSIPSSGQCVRVDSGASPGSEVYQLAMNFQTVKILLEAPSGYPCVPDASAGGSGETGGLNATPNGPIGVSIGHEQASGDFYTNFCNISKWVQAADGQVYRGMCTPPTYSSAKFVVGGPRTNYGIVVETYRAGSPEYGHDPYPSYWVLSFNGSQGGTLSMYCSLPTQFASDCKVDISNFIAGAKVAEGI